MATAMLVAQWSPVPTRALGKVNSKTRSCSRKGQSGALTRTTGTKISADTTQSPSIPQKARETVLLSAAPAPIVSLAAAEWLREALEPTAEVFRSWDLPYWLVHWGHPGNMAVVLFAMGGYGSYLGWQIKLAGDAETRLKARDAHPKLMAGMFFFFALGAFGGVTSLVMQGQSIFDSPHAYTGLLGLSLLTVQVILSAKFKENPDFRSAHAYLGSATMLLFLVHAALGLKFGLSF